MEIFEVQFRGKTLIAKKDGNGKIYVVLPKRKAKNGHEIHEIISKDLKGWKYAITRLDDFTHSLDIWIRDDGKIAYKDYSKDSIAVSKESFNPDSPNVGKLNNIVTELYKTVEQLKAYDTRDIPASTMIKLRRINLMSKLNLLGYSNVDDVKSELDDSKVYFALSRIGRQLKSYINIGAYVHVEGMEEDEDLIRLNVPEGMTREQFLEMVEPVKDEYSANLAFSKEQEEKREQKRSILPDYCAEASKKMPPADWLFYSRICRETAKLLLELNADMLGPEIKKENSDLSQLTGQEKEDRISRLIDSKDFAKACEIEKGFLAKEAQRLVDEVKYMLSEIGEVARKTSVGKALQEIIQEENEFINESKGETLQKREAIGIDD